MWGDMKPTDLLIKHQAEIQKLYAKNGTWLKTYKKISESVPEIVGMSLATFEQYAPITMEVCKWYITSNLLANLVSDNKLNEVKQELKTQQELNRLNDAELYKKMMLICELNKQIEQVSQKLNTEIESNRINDANLKEQIRLNTELNNSVEKLNSQLNNLAGLNLPVKYDEDLCTVKQKLSEVKQEANSQIKLNKEVKQDQDKQKLNIAGWSIQKSNGYYRGFKKIAGKVQGVYLGKTLDDAEQKIMKKNYNFQYNRNQNNMLFL